VFLKSFKNRQIDLSKPVKVYRNLGRNPGDYSVMQNGLVVAHTDRILLSDVTFRVSRAGQERVVFEKKKNVHAYAVGKIATKGCFGAGPDFEGDFGMKVRYNPYDGPYFTFVAHPDKKVLSARGVLIRPEGIEAVYTVSERLPDYEGM
jgi:hypothetical protein